MKCTWKEAVLNRVKDLCQTSQSLTVNTKQLSIDSIVAQTRSRAKNPQATLHKTLKELCDLKILVSLGNNQYQYLIASDNHNLVYKERRSMGHLRVANCLQALSILFEEEKTFDDLKRETHLRLDFYFEFYGQQAAIEFDGVQHTTRVKGWDNSLSDSQHRDTIKNNYCRDKSIILLRIPHTEKNVEEAVNSFIRGLFIRTVATTILSNLVFLINPLRGPLNPRPATRGIVHKHV